MFLYSSAVGEWGMCIPTFVDFFLFHFFFFVSFVFFFLLFLSRCSQGPYGIFFFFLRSSVSFSIPSSLDHCDATHLTPTSIILLTIHFLAGDQLVVPRGGVTHISCHYKNTIEGVGEKQDKRTNTDNMLGVNSRAKREYATLHFR